MTDIVHERAATEFADYDLTWDAASRITDIDFDFLGTNYDDDASYTYDDTSQLTDADYTTQADENYVYDDNGNRTLVDGTDTYTTGDQNRLTSDGTYYYTYDNEGNRTGKYSDASRTTPVEKYFWDHRNRMTKTELYVSGELDKTVEYAYDHDNRMYSRIVDAASDSRQIFVRDNDQIVLELADDNVGDVNGSDLTRRALWQLDAVDQLLAEGHIGDDTYWMLTDHLGTVRDMVAYNSATDTTALEQHNEFTSFGVLLSTPTIESLGLYTGRFYDYLTQKQYNRERWYDLSSGRWMSVDPIGFEAGDVNLYRYVGNAVANATDSTGLSDWGIALPGGSYAPPQYYPPSLPEPIPPVNGVNFEKIAQDMENSSSCNDKGCTCPRECLKDLLHQAYHHKETCLIGNCQEWADHFKYDDKFGSGNKCFQFRQVEFIYLFYDLIPGDWDLSHTAIQVTTCDGSEFYLDDGWWGGGMYGTGPHVFGPDDIPIFVRPVSQPKLIPW